MKIDLTTLELLVKQAVTNLKAEGGHGYIEAYWDWDAIVYTLSQAIRQELEEAPFSVDCYRDSNGFAMCFRWKKK